MAVDIEPTSSSAARTVRLRRLYRHTPKGLLIAPIDHSLAIGPVTPAGWSLDDLAGALVRGGADAVVMHKGAIRHVSPAVLAGTAVVVHLNGSSASAPDPDEKVLLTSVEEALRLGADAVSMHINFGAASEPQQLQDLARVARACDEWALPLLAMVYARGPCVQDPRDPRLVQQAVTIAADLGADLVKTVQVSDPGRMAEIVAQTPVPLLLAGGPVRASTAELADDVRTALATGVAGLAMGRCLFQAADPQRTTAMVAALVHQRPELVPTIEKEAKIHAHGNEAALA